MIDFVLLCNRVQSCSHVIGADYGYIVSCRYNRKSFVYCCRQAFSHMSPDTMMSVLDFYCMLQMICKDIPFVLIQESANSGCFPSNLSPPLYRLDDFCISLNFRFIYTEWISLLESLFFEGTSRNSVNRVSISVLSRNFDDWNLSLSSVIPRPAISQLKAIIQSLFNTNMKNDIEVNFEHIMSEIIHNAQIRMDVISFKPKGSILSILHNLP
jgi:hypothetical protein